MKLWLLEAIDGASAFEPWYDKAFGFVVRAATEGEARQTANDNGGDEVGPSRVSVYRIGEDPWLDPAQTTCVVLTSEGEPGVVLQDFRSA